MTEKLFHVGVKALIVNADNKILIIKANPAQFIRKNEGAYWDIPGGRIQAGETTPQTLAREVMEEIGVTNIQDVSLLTSVIANTEIPISETESVGLVLMIYKTTIPADAGIILSEENTEYAWADKDMAAERLAYKYPSEFTSKIAQLL